MVFPVKPSSFDERISFVGFVAIMVVMCGVVFMSGLVFNGGFKKFIGSLNNPTVFYGLFTGFCFSISAFNLKSASAILLPLGYSNFKAALVVLLWVICFQNILFVIVKSYQNRLVKDLKSLILLENKSAFFKTSLFSFLASVCWFAAYGAGKVVYVKAVGQTELIMAIAASHFILKEELKMPEIVGIFLTSAGILGLIFFG